jgi:hypothetical protein
MYSSSFARNKYSYEYFKIEGLAPSIFKYGVCDDFPILMAGSAVNSSSNQFMIEAIF